MISKFRKKPDCQEYYKLSCKNRSYYYESRENAERHLNAYKNDPTSKTAWVLYHVICDKNGVEVVKPLGIVRREEVRISKPPESTSQRKEFDLTDLIKSLAVNDAREEVLEEEITERLIRRK